MASFPSSYIPTTTAAVTRNADVCSITGTEFSEWYRQGVGTGFVESVTGVGYSQSSILRMALSFGGGNAASSIRITSSRGHSDPYNSAWMGDAFDPDAGVTLRQAISMNGTTAISDTNLSNPAGPQSYTSAVGNRMNIGHYLSGSFHNGWIKRVQFYPQALTATQLQALTRG